MASNGGAPRRDAHGGSPSVSWAAAAIPAAVVLGLLAIVIVVCDGCRPARAAPGPGAPAPAPAGLEPARVVPVPDLPVPGNDAEHVRETADQVLGRPEYRVASPTLVERVQRWIADMVGRFVGALINGGGASVTAWALLVLAVGLAVLLASRFARGVTPDAGRHTTTVTAAAKTAADWRAEAEGHERAGRWRPALRCRYRALVADLAAEGVVDEVPGRTAGEYRAAVNVAAPGVAGDFAAVTELFERAWYGHASTGADDAARLSSLSDRVLAGTG